MDMNKKVNEEYYRTLIFGMLRLITAAPSTTENKQTAIVALTTMLAMIVIRYCGPEAEAVMKMLAEEGYKKAIRMKKEAEEKNEIPTRYERPPFDPSSQGGE